jgi:hypothetical protein
MTTQVPNKNSPLIGCDVRVMANASLLRGFIFRFADGSSTLIGVNGGDSNTDPRMPTSGSMVTMSANFPDGCDMITVKNYDTKSYPTNVWVSLFSVVITFSKNGAVVGNIDAQLAPATPWMLAQSQPQYPPQIPSDLLRQGSRITVEYGQIISGFTCTFAKDPIANYDVVLSFAAAYGMADPKAKPIDGGWSAWSAPSICSAACGPGLIIQTRTCTNPVPVLGGKDCTADGSSDTLATPCNLGACPVNGGWSAWDPWGNCVGDCSTGLGIQSRKRYCNNPSPANGGTQCEGAASQTQICNMTSCPFDGGWSPYSEWGTCSKTCGGGTQSRTRTCTNPTPANGGASCVGDAVDSQSCNTQPCPTNGGWSDWSPWGGCVNGESLRNRLCNNPAPSNGGIGCIGDFTQTQTCIPSANTVATPASIGLGAPGTANVPDTPTTPPTTTAVITAPPDPTTGHVTSTVTTSNPDGSTSTTNVTHDPATGNVVSVVPVAQPNYTLFFMVLLVVLVVLYYSLKQPDTVSGAGDTDDLTIAAGTTTNAPTAINI